MILTFIYFLTQMCSDCRTIDIVQCSRASQWYTGLIYCARVNYADSIGPHLQPETEAAAAAVSVM